MPPRNQAGGTVLREPVPADVVARVRELVRQIGSVLSAAKRLHVGITTVEEAMSGGRVRSDALKRIVEGLDRGAR